MQPTGERWRLGHRPALDGLRGIAVLLVVVSHYALWTDALSPLGTMGVSLFFGLSGFLITSLLLQERDAAGSVHMGYFYMRRAARLLPALVLMLVFEIGIGAITLGDFLAALGYVSNWVQIATGDPTPIGFTWSLAVEEQFYLAWPVVLLAALRFGGRRAAAVVAVTGAVLSIGLRLALFDQANYFVGRSTITNADAILLGCALAACMKTGGRGRPNMAVALIFGLAVACILAPSLAFVPTATAVIGVTCVWLAARGPESGLLGHKLLAMLGRRSYALYLWHVPVLKIALSTTLPLWAVITVSTCVSWAVVSASWRWVESPILRWSHRRVVRSDSGRVERSAVQGDLVDLSREPLGEPVVPRADR